MKVGKVINYLNNSNEQNKEQYKTDQWKNNKWKNKLLPTSFIIP